METLDRSDRERRHKKKRKAKGLSFAALLLKTILALAPLLTKLVQLVILVADAFR